MNINDLQGGSPKHIHGAASKINTPHGKPEAKGLPKGEFLKQTQHVPDPEVSKLVSQLTESPEIRTERIAEVQQKIQSGDFFSRQNAEATAKAFTR